MLLLRAEGLHSCPQMAWSQVRETVAEVLSPSDGLILFCGMSMGYEDPTVSYAVTGRAPFGEIAVQRHEKFDAVFATDQPVSAIEKDYN